MILLLNNCIELFIVSQLCAYPFSLRNIEIVFITYCKPNKCAVLEG